jgi:predicted membrane metal-binding protein
VTVLLALCAGIVADRFCPLPLWAWWLVALCSLAVWPVLWRRGRLRMAAVAVLIAAAATAAAWHHDRWYLFAADDLGHFARSAAQPVCIEARALKTPRTVAPSDSGPMSVVRSGSRVRLDVELLALRDGADWRPVSGRAHMQVEGLLPVIAPGDRLRVFAKLIAPPQPHNPGEFDGAMSARSDRVLSELQVGYVESVTLLQPGSPWRLSRGLEAVRMFGNRLFARYLGKSHAELADAVLLGGREQVEPDRIEAFVETGTIHLLV